ncbi:NADH-quinone oxidoreductase subunit A [Actinomadura rudentiformis]|uniref:NADH-quinone oxidoreductase subunit n=1 Tax=Actinomadura rudentiformis TaxID=359158 RepID=A0A6H9YTX0_9ACTN|nr:NADH-quinone oxidoreductase subunit A [Actinomadura rudentiformis]KAB2346944.1 NADH-quinone oxidoreductase subunit A [Actinomadura rudentiformis]
MNGYQAALVVMLLVVALVAAVYALGTLAAVARSPLEGSPFLSGEPSTEHAVSRFHVRWYTITMVFLAFDMEMIFMYPWTVVVADMGATAVVEMFLFLGLLLVGVVYAWREGAFRWV